MKILEVNDLKKVYTSRFSQNTTSALNGINFTIEEGEFVAIMGESGSGKTTLLNILSGIDTATSGKVLLDSHDISKIKEKELTEFRRDHLGFVFQEFNLLDTFSNRDNILLPLVLSQKSIEEMEKRLKKVAAELGITSLLHKYPFEISGGQRQRVAVARALINHPRIILADEPTGALDSKSSDELLNVFDLINKNNQTILMVTHSTKAASYASRVLFIKDGKIFHQIYKADDSNEKMFAKISDTLTMLTKGAD